MSLIQQSPFSRDVTIQQTNSHILFVEGLMAGPKTVIRTNTPTLQSEKVLIRLWWIGFLIVKHDASVQINGSPSAANAQHFQWPWICLCKCRYLDEN